MMNGKMQRCPYSREMVNNTQRTKVKPEDKKIGAPAIVIDRNLSDVCQRTGSGTSGLHHGNAGNLNCVR